MSEPSDEVRQDVAAGMEEQEVPEPAALNQVLVIIVAAPPDERKQLAGTYRTAEAAASLRRARALSREMT
jgi:hypothetical protein